MREIGATPYTYNNIEPLLNAYVSLQIRSSKRVGYEASTDNTEHILMAEYLKQLAYNIQTQNDHVYFSSQKFNLLPQSTIFSQKFREINARIYS